MRRDKNVPRDRQTGPVERRKALVAWVQERQQVTAADLAAKEQITLKRASMRLHQMVEAGELERSVGARGGAAWFTTPRLL